MCYVGFAKKNNQLRVHRSHATPRRTVKHLLLSLLVLAAVTACGNGSSTVTSLVTPTTALPAPPQARLSIVGAAANDLVAYAVVGVTPVRFDATASTGERLTYVIDFGDGSDPVTSSSATHVFSKVGRFTAQATVADRAGCINQAGLENFEPTRSSDARGPARRVFILFLGRVGSMLFSLPTTSAI